MSMVALGLDVGDQRIGVAVSDPQGMLAVPVGVIQRVGGPADLEAIVEHARSRQAEVIVVGMPFSLSGRRGPQAQAVEAFVEELRSVTELVLTTWDERLTTVEADRRLREVSGKRRGGASPAKLRPARLRKEAQDGLAASIMLQAYLDAQRWRQREPLGRPAP